MKRKATAADKSHMAAIQAMGCQLCLHLGHGPTPAEIHHCRTRLGWGRSSHRDVIGLCPQHHRGEPGGIHSHGRDEFTAMYGISEIDLLRNAESMTVF